MVVEVGTNGRGNRDKRSRERGRAGMLERNRVRARVCLRANVRLSFYFVFFTKSELID